MFPLKNLTFILIEGTRSLGAGVIESCEMPHRCLESSSGLLEERHIILITDRINRLIA